MARSNSVGRRDFPQLPTHATYWVRDPQSNWTSVTTEEAGFIHGTPKGAYAHLPKRGRRRRSIEVALLSVMPPQYTSKSDAERGLAVVLWDWSLGPKTCSQIQDRIRRLTEEDIRRCELTDRPMPTYARNFLTLGERLCGVARNGSRSTRARKNAPKIGKGQKRNQRSVLGAALRKDK